jgi:uncharacterized protein YbbC (DUF1343 family)/CubicO group peptidase (beta-lactamase class C family)
MFRPLLLLTCGAIAISVAAAEPFFPEKLREMDAAVRLAITDGRLPGGVLWIERNGESYHAAFGRRAVEPKEEPMAEDTIFDAASLTKVMATTPAIMKLIEQGKVEIDAKANKYLPELTGEGKDEITVRHLMTHSSGTKSGIPNSGWEGYDGGIATACSTALANPPGMTFRYSDINFILLGEIVRRASGKTLAEFCAAEIYGPLQMRDTMYKPGEALLPRVAPTTRDTPRGAVHDPTARRMDGIAGHAGLFTTASDTARFARMMLGEGELEGVRILKPETVRLMTTVQSVDGPKGRRGLGWDIDTSYSGPRGKWFPVGSYGHTGWTGGSMWIDPFSKSFIVFLSNRNHPTESGNVLPLRQLLGTLAAESINGFNFLYVPAALKPIAGTTVSSGPKTLTRGQVLNGIDVLARDGFKQLKGMRVGLITNHTGIDRQRRRTIDLLAKAKDMTLVALFSPEHGIAGKADEKIGDTREPQTGLPVYSLYGERRVPAPEQIADLDALVFDIQDIGCRFYTYSATLGECLAAAGKAGKKFFVLDRPNPIGGVIVEGPVLDGKRSFTAWHDVPLRHGMTLGELARMYNDERKLGADLTVIPCEGWSRALWFDETGLPWLNPSPNMRSLPSATLYPGVGLLEFSSLSVGRGTDRPFEIVGAPYIDDLRLAAELTAADLPGVSFSPLRFTPREYIFAGKECGGVAITLTDRRSCNAVDVGIEIARALQKLYPKEWGIEKLSKLLVHPATEKGVAEMSPLSAIHKTWVQPREAFAKRRSQFLLYQ